jgi:hypothetical protein
VDVLLSATDTAAGVYRTMYSTDGGSLFSVLTGANVVRLEGNGTNTLQYYSIDRADNNEATSTLSVFIQKQASPSVTVSATTSCSYGTACQSANTFTKSLTVSSAKQYLIVDAYQQSNNCSGTVTATYNGEAMTQFHSVSFSGVHWKQFELAHPDVGTHDIVVTKPSGSCDFEFVATLFSNVDMNAPTNTRATASGGSGGSLSTSVTGVDRGIIHSAIASPNNINVSPNSPLTTVVNASVDYPGLMSATTSATGSVTASWSIASQGCCSYWAIISTQLLPDPFRPETTITSQPDPLTEETSATFTFASDEPGYTFTCRLDGGSAAPCVSPVTYTGLSSTHHVFEVYATDLEGHDDVTAARAFWRIGGGIVADDMADCMFSDPCQTGNTTTLPVTVRQEDEYLIVNAYQASASCSGTVTATHDGASMTQTTSVSFSGAHLKQFVLADPATGTRNVVVTKPSGSCDFHVTAASFIGVDLGDPYGTIGTNSGGSGGSMSTTATGVTDGLIYSVFASPNKAGVTPNSPLLMALDGRSQRGDGGATVVGGVTPNTGSVTTSWTIANQECCAYWAIISTPLKPDGGESLMGGGGEGEWGSMMTGGEEGWEGQLFQLDEAEGFTESATSSTMMEENSGSPGLFGIHIPHNVTGSVTGTWMTEEL